MISIDIKLPRKNFDLVIKEDFSDGITGIFGPSGSGKSSLLQALAGLCRPESGHIMINFKVVYDSERKINCPVQERQVGYVFQEGRLFPHLTVEKNLLYGFKKDINRQISYKEVVRLLNLGPLLKSKPANISGGERQRTALGRALLSSPQVLLLDEPFSAQDANLRDQILPFLYKIHREVNIPILVVSHDISDLLKLTNRLFVIDKGRCLGHDDYSNLLYRPKIRQLVGTNVLVNTLEVKVKAYDKAHGILDLYHDVIVEKMVAVCKEPQVNMGSDQLIKLFIRSDDVVLATTYVEGLSVHNQISGIVTAIIEAESVCYCMVDVGVPFSVELTKGSVERLQLAVGQHVWCLFKSVALDVVA